MTINGIKYVVLKRALVLQNPKTGHLKTIYMPTFTEKLFRLLEKVFMFRT